MSRTAFPLEILPRAEALIKKELQKRQLQGHFKLRLQILILSNGRIRNKDIACQLGCGLEMVRRWRRRWLQHQEVLRLSEKGDDTVPPLTNNQLLDKIKTILSDEQRLGCPCRITETEVDRLVALACESPDIYGYPVTHWTHELLSTQIIKMGIQVSASHAGKLLKKRLTSPQK